MNKNSDDLPRFSRQLMCPKQEELGNKIWFPDWNCYCCHDTGTISPRLVKLIIPDYDLDRDKLPFCQKSGCSEGDKYLNNPSIASSLDWRFDNKLCQKLDAIEREEWRLERDRTISQLNVIDFAKERSLRRRSRSKLEQELVNINHQTERDR